MAELAIIIPAYKRDFLRETLESLSCQTNRNFHVYIGDDCSPNDLESIVIEYAGRVPMTYHRFETNLGSKNLVGQWERCIGLSRDEKWLWLFSDDDLMEPHCVEAFYKTIQLHPAGELFHFNLKIKDDLKGGMIRDINYWPEQMSAGEYLESKLRGKVISYVVEFIFLRTLYERVGGFKNYDLAWGSDFMTWLHMASQNPEGIVTIEGKNRCIIWRKSAQNISPDKSRPILLRKLTSLIENATFIKEQLKNYAENYRPLKYSFRWIRFPLGEIYKNRKILKSKDVVSLVRYYIKNVILK